MTDMAIAEERETPITPQEWWDIAPWNYDMDSAPKNLVSVLLKDAVGNIEKAYEYNSEWVISEDKVFDNPVAWLPLPEQSQ